MTGAAAASASQQDLRSPDARDAAAGHGNDVSSPQMFTDRQRVVVTRFKRSPSYQQALREAITAVKPPQPAPVRADEGIDWRDAGVGAASLLGVIALGLVGAITILQRRRRGRRTATVARHPEPTIDANAGPACPAPRRAGTPSGAAHAGKRNPPNRSASRLPRTSNRSAAWAAPVHPVPRHDLYACELPIGGSLSTVAVAMRHTR
jgi:hypothetical protein